MSIPRALWETAKAFGVQQEIPPEKALGFMLTRINHMVIEGDTTFLGPELRAAAKAARAENLGQLEDGPKIELDKLHRSDKTKSGYVGVYANGQGFRAMGRTRDSTVQIYLGQFDTAEAAAWCRLLHYRAEGLAYGELETEIETYRKRFNLTGSDESVIALIREDATRDGYLHVLFPGDGPGTKIGQIEPKMVGFDVPPDTSEYEK